MKSFFLFFISLTMSSQPIPLFDFQPTTTEGTWRIVDDGVMGGLSQGNFRINEEGFGEFRGEVSLENNGGFSSVRYRPEETIFLDPSTSKVVLRVRGDGSRYQFRVKEKSSQWHNQVVYFETSGEWERIELPFSDFRPTFRGRALDLPGFSGEQIAEMAFLIGNKVEQSFRLEIDWIGVE